MYYADDAATPTTAADVCNRLVNQKHVDAIVGFESTPSQAACNTYLTNNKMPYVLAQTSTSGSICLDNYFSLANVGNQQVNPLVDYLTHKLGTKKIYIVASDFSSGSLGASQVTARARAKRAGRRQLVRAARHDRLLERHRQDRRRAARHGDRHPRRQRRDRVLQAVQDRPALEGHQDGELPDGRRHRRGDRREAPQGTVNATGYSPENPSKGNQQFVDAMKKKYGDKAQITGAAAAAWDGDLHPRPGAQEREVDLRQPTSIAAMMNAKSRARAATSPSRTATTSPRRRYLLQRQKDGSAKLVGKRSGSRRSRSNPAC